MRSKKIGKRAALAMAVIATGLIGLGAPAEAAGTSSSTVSTTDTSTTKGPNVAPLASMGIRW